MRGDSVKELLQSLHTTANEEERRLWAAACAQALGLGGITISVGRELVWFSDATSKRLEDLQFVLGQGPGLLLDDESSVREVPDLEQALAQRWPQYATEATLLGIAALFVWPVHIGAVEVGTMTGYRRTPGLLGERQSANGWLVAEALAEYVLNHWPATVGDREGDGLPGGVGLHRAEVHQATGMLSARLRIPLPEALDRLRAQTYISRLSLTDTAHAVLRRELLWETGGDTD
ncbi:ANTAR domain-containing protein [Streptomyces apricus]|uniref:ANTAR domain-containing protein n=1 Tax=Streptomyces apricus TaxID=1828112 RepID=A0A5B0BNE0_9ACTN|nr:ANTAR domain-containing protein [Streptomyces apricus]KAA0943206.1 ANTAR domain-containing protein [Streptomyces apricus]